MKVSIIIPCYNAEKWIEDSIMSALNQTYSNVEVIFVDNESTDKSKSIAERIQKENPILIVDSAPNLYDYSWEEPVEKAMTLCTGDYFTILGADDFIDKDYIKNIVNIISKSAGKIRALQSPLRGTREGTLVGEIGHFYHNLEDFKKQLFEKCVVTTPTLVYSKDLYDGGLIEWNSKDFYGAGDYYCYFNLADKGVFIYPFPKWIGYNYRWHQDQSTWGMHRNFNNMDLKIKKIWRDRWGEKDIESS